MGFLYLNPFLSAAFSELDYMEEHSVKPLCKSHFCFFFSYLLLVVSIHSIGSLKRYNRCQKHHIWE